MEERVSRVLNELRYGSFTPTDEEALQGVVESFFCDDDNLVSTAFDAPTGKHPFNEYSL